MSGRHPVVSQAPSKPVLLLGLLIIGLAAWFLLRSFTSPAARECRTLYRSARTSADTALVDSTVTAGASAQSEPRTCGFMRVSNRWQ
jgi:hypothetical protein